MKVNVTWSCGRGGGFDYYCATCLQELKWKSFWNSILIHPEGNCQYAGTTWISQSPVITMELKAATEK